MHPEFLCPVIHVIKCTRDFDVQQKCSFKAPCTRILKCLYPQIFFFEYGMRPHVSDGFGSRIRKFSSTISKVGMFEYATNSDT